MAAFVISGILGGGNMVLWGLYGDLLAERCSIFKIVRSLFLGAFFGMFFYFLDPGIPLFVVVLMVISLERFSTEIYKALIRNENQEKYCIPSDLNLRFPIKVKRVVGLIIVFGMLILVWNIDIKLSRIYLTILAGMITAMGGMSKDAPYEGFSIRKFFRSPIVSLIVAVFIAILFSEISGKYFLLAVLGGERIISEFYKKIFNGRAPGKFKESLEISNKWQEQRKILLPIYAANVVSILVLALSRL